MNGLRCTNHRLKAAVAGLSQTAVIVTAVLFMMATANYSLWREISHVYPVSAANLPWLLSLGVFFTAVTALFFLLISYGRATRWILALFLVIASQAAYFMDHLGVIIDTVMIDNIMQTSVNESLSLVTPALVIRTIFLGLIPAWLVIQYCPPVRRFKPELIARMKALLLCVGLMFISIAPFTAAYSSFFREHKIVRFYANPTYAVYSAIKYGLQQSSITAHLPLLKIAEDALLLDPPTSKKELVIMVVGETARADRFSLNGYPRLTNPLLSQLEVVSFKHVASCGTSTGVSVPCMFSSLGREHYDKEKALSQENVLDVLAKNGIEVLWRDNNSDSKGVATRVRYEDFKSPTLNPVCDEECRDIGMLGGLESYIRQHADQDILIVLHQIGNHGPEYYRRYPKAFERFTPACQTGELRDCSQAEIDNAYDNAILYTDYFLAEVIRFLKQYDADHETAMLYVADHGESLGEHGIYLHAAPYMIAPVEQTHIPAVVWFGKNFDYRLKDIKPYQDHPLSHDDLFCTLLATYEIDSHLCKNEHQLLAKNKNLKLSLAGD
jgi:lipid A ethanolaminephosphotransferase